MFDENVYFERRKKLKELVGSGIILLPGNEEAAMNYPANHYAYRQDSTFLYYFGLDMPGAAGIIDVDNNRDILFGDDRSVDDVVWMGDAEPMAELARKIGVKENLPLAKLSDFVKDAQHKKTAIHYLPQYRGEQLIRLEELLGISHKDINSRVSEKLRHAVISQRSIKAEEEIEEIEEAVHISYVMNTTAMRSVSDGLKESEIYGIVDGISIAMGSGLSFPVICSVNGSVLHNHYRGNIMKNGDLLLLDSGSETQLHYASDITRTFPVSGKFSDRQKAVYETVLKSQLAAIDMMKPGVEFRDCHLKSALVIAAGLTELGLMKGDPAEAVSNGAHALFFPHGLGHMMGLDVHDMEGLGENNVGYDDKVKRSEQFGLSALRFGKVLKEGFVLTVEPGIYFIENLFEQWKSEKKLEQFLNYDEIQKYMGFGGVRIEDDVLVTKDGHRVLGTPIPKTVNDVEETCQS